MGDCIDIISNPQKEITYGPPQIREIPVKNMENVISRYYIRLTALDQPGVLHKISGILSEYSISLESVNQEKNEEEPAVPIFLVTHEASEKNIKSALSQNR